MYGLGKKSLGNLLRLVENRVYDRIVAAIRAVSVRRNFFAPFDFFLKRSKREQISGTFFVVCRFSLHAPNVLTSKSGTPCICTYTWRETTSATIRISFPRRASLFLEFDYTIHSCKLTVR